MSNRASAFSALWLCRASQSDSWSDIGVGLFCSGPAYVMQSFSLGRLAYLSSQNVAFGVPYANCGLIWPLQL